MHHQYVYELNTPISHELHAFKIYIIDSSMYDVNLPLHLGQTLKSNMQ